MNKKGFGMGMGMGAGRKAFSLIVGLVFLILGGIPLLSAMNIIGFDLPSIPTFIFWVLALLGAVALIIDGFSEGRGFGGGKKVVAFISIILAVVLVIYGLGSFGVLPFSIPEVGVLVVNIIFTLAGLLLIIGGFMSSW